MGRNDLTDIAILVGLGIVGVMAYQKFYPGKSPEEVFKDLDTKLRGFLDTIQLPALPALPSLTPPAAAQPAISAITPPAAPPSSADEPKPTGIVDEPTNTANDVRDEPEATVPPVIPKGSGQLSNNPQVTPSAGTTIVAFAGDWRSSNATKQGADMIDKLGASLIIGLGDYSYSKETQTWFDQFIGPRWKGKFKGAIGNHDSDGYSAVFGQSQGIWNFVHKVNDNLAVVFIDTNKGIDEAILLSLTKAAKGQAKFVVYAFHKPYVTDASKHSGSENKWSSIIEKVATANGVKLILAGHNHVYEHSFANGKHYVTSGAIGADYYSTGCKLPGAVKCINSTQGFLKVTVSSASLLCQFVGANGSPLDSFTIS